MKNSRKRPPSKGKNKKSAPALQNPKLSGNKHIRSLPKKPPVQSKRKHSEKNEKKRLDPAGKFMKDYLKQLREGRKGRALTRAELEQNVQKWERECAGLKAEVKVTEALAKKRKREIDDWKQWYHGIPKIDKSEEWAKLEVEIAWRAQEIIAAQHKINQLYEKHLVSQTQLEMARHWLIAYDQGILDKPLKEDPRYIQIMQLQSAGPKR